MKIVQWKFTSEGEVRWGVLPFFLPFSSVQSLHTLLTAPSPSHRYSDNYMEHHLCPFSVCHKMLSHLFWWAYSPGYNSLSCFHCKNYFPYSTVSCNQVRSGYPSCSTKRSYQPRCSINSSSNNSKKPPNHYVLHMNGHDYYLINLYFLHILFK